MGAEPYWYFEKYDEDIDGEECECRDPDLYDPDEETLSPGDMEII